MKTKETLIIKSSEWARGARYDNKGVKIYNPLNGVDNKRCCLGLDALRCGFTPDQILDVLGPCSLRRSFEENGRTSTEKQKEYFDRWNNYYERFTAIDINDSETLTDEMIIDKLRPIFAKFNIEIDWRPDE